MDAARSQFGAPTPIELVGRAMGAFGAGDTRLTGPVTISDRRTYGAFPTTTASDARIVHVTGNLTIASTARVSGNGLLLVDGDLTVLGRLEWTGLIVVRPREQHTAVDWSAGRVTLNGGLVVDQEAPPPGGHTDVTINRTLSGNWGTGSIGETGPGTPGHREYGAYANSVGLPGLLYDHEHRFENATPEKRTIHFAGLAGSPADRHESYTWFRKTLADLAAAQPAERFYVRFKNPTGHGAALFNLVMRGGTTINGAVATGFGTQAPGRPLRLAELCPGRPHRVRGRRAEPAPAHAPDGRRGAAEPVLALRDPDLPEPPDVYRLPLGPRRRARGPDRP